MLNYDKEVERLDIERFSSILSKGDCEFCKIGKFCRLPKNLGKDCETIIKNYLSSPYIEEPYEVLSYGNEFAIFSKYDEDNCLIVCNKEENANKIVEILNKDFKEY